MDAISLKHSISMLKIDLKAVFFSKRRDFFFYCFLPLKLDM